MYLIMCHTNWRQLKSDHFLYVKLFTHKKIKGIGGTFCLGLRLLWIWIIVTLRAKLIPTILFAGYAISNDSKEWITLLTPACNTTKIVVTTLMKSIFYSPFHIFHLFVSLPVIVVALLLWSEGLKKYEQFFKRTFLPAIIKTVWTK